MSLPTKIDISAPKPKFFGIFNSFVFPYLFSFLLICTILLALYYSKGSKAKTRVSEDDPDWMTKMDELHAERRERVEETCNNHDYRSVKTKHLEQFMLDVDLGLGYCLTPRVGSTTVLSHFLNLLDLSENKTRQLQESDAKMHRNFQNHFSLENSDVEINEISQLTELLESQEDMLTFSFVRHPFERLVSAYETRLASDESNERFFVDFPSFVKFILVKAQTTKCFNQNTVGCMMSNIWRPFYANCAFCEINYDVVGKLETFEKDLLYVIIRKNMSHAVDLNQLGMKLRASEPKENKTLYYFRQLTAQQRKKLKALYSIDFEMFDYDPEPFM